MTKVEYDQRRQIKRGDIYYVEIPYHTGHEIYKDRPGIVVSAPDVQRNNLVWVVFCSASRVADSAEHVTIRTTPEVSTALVEQLYAVDLSRVGKFLGTCTDREMQMVDLALQRI
ncbi:MAG: type II toxin-antitoxin system PemK/MazF family toxin, partial [Clostridia bacterium]|nr:type II toxin-antitoxin system PemK/MazF family toxin [Clostridia bacterium]